MITFFTADARKQRTQQQCFRLVPGVVLCAKVQFPAELTTGNSFFELLMPKLLVSRVGCSQVPAVYVNIRTETIACIFSNQSL